MAFATAAAILLVLTLTSSTFLLRARFLTIAVAEQDVVELQTAQELLTDTYAMELAEQTFLSQATDAALKEHGTATQRVKADLNRLLLAQRVGADDLKALQEIKRELTEYQSLWERRAHIVKGEASPEEAAAFRELTESETLLVSHLDPAIKSLVERRVRAAQMRIQEMTRSVTLAAILVITAVVVATLAFAATFRMALELARRVRALSEEVAAIESKGLTVRVGDSGDDEIARLGKSFNDILTSLGHLVSLVTGRLQGASQVLGKAASEQTGIVKQQGDYMADALKTFEELSASGSHVTGATGVVEQAVVSTAEAVGTLERLVEALLAGVRDIRGSSAASAEAMGQHSKQLVQVTRIAGDIDQIADRADLLALNAALEGAKAGDVGRGFALVAAEVRKLAENVSSLSRDITRIVEGVRQSGAEAVQRASEGAKAADRGLRSAEQAFALLRRVKDLADGSRKAVHEISAAMTQQGDSAARAIDDASQIAASLEEGVRAMKRVNEVAAELQGIAQELVGASKRFA